MPGLKFRVLLDSEGANEVFRDILIDSESTYEEFYKNILQNFNFGSDQMASFYMSNDNWDKGEEITLMDMSFGEEESSIPIMSKTKIHEYIEHPDQKIILVHDFLRMWIFLIELIGYETEGPATPQLILRVGEAPAEDSKKAEDNEGLFMGDFDEEEDDDEFGFNDFDNDYSDEDFGSFDDYEF